MILLLFPFIPLFESPQMDFLAKRYAEFKKRTFENLDLETILLSDLPLNVTLKFQPLWVWKSYVLYPWISSFQICRFRQILICQEELVKIFPQCVDFWTIQDSELVMNATCYCFNFILWN